MNTITTTVVILALEAVAVPPLVHLWAWLLGLPSPVRPRAVLRWARGIAGHTSPADPSRDGWRPAGAAQQPEPVEVAP